MVRMIPNTLLPAPAHNDIYPWDSQGIPQHSCRSWSIWKWFEFWAWNTYRLTFMTAVKKQKYLLHSKVHSFLQRRERSATVTWGWHALYKGYLVWWLGVSEERVIAGVDVGYDSAILWILLILVMISASRSFNFMATSSCRNTSKSCQNFYSTMLLTLIYNLQKYVFIIWFGSSNHQNLVKFLNATQGQSFMIVYIVTLAPKFFRFVLSKNNHWHNIKAQR